MEHGIDVGVFADQRLADVMPDEMIARSAAQQVHRCGCTCRQVVDADHFCSVGKQPLAQVTAEEAAAAGYQYPL